MIGLLYLFGMMTSIGLFAYFSGRRNVIGMLCMGAFFLRIFVAVVLDSGMKYLFVLDSLAYERDAWLLAQSWVTSGKEFYSLPDGFLGRNLYELILAGIFYVFGQEPLTAVFINVIVATLTIALIIHIHTLFFRDPEKKDRQGPQVIGLALLAIYPSSLVWAATNIRDPIYFLASVLLIYFFLQAFSSRSRWPSVPRFGAVLAAGFCFAVVLGMRSYVGVVFIIGLASGTFLALLAPFVKPRTLLIGSVAMITIVAFTWQLINPGDAAEFLTSVEKTRRAFSNAGLDDYAQSSFALDYKFATMGDLFRFVPLGLVYYFLAPFPWQVTSTVQAMSLIEVFAVYALIWPVWIGIRKTYTWARFETAVVIGFVTTMAIAQSVMISNSGTIFRHRTLGFMLLAIFAGIGIDEIWTKKNRKAVLPA